MANPGWQKAPCWANYAAQDKDGLWWWYEIEPFRIPSGWDVKSGNVQQATFPVAIKPIKRPKNVGSPNNHAGEKNGRAKLTTQQVRNMRKMLEAGAKTQREIAKKFGMSLSAVQAIKYNRAWTHV